MKEDIIEEFAYLIDRMTNKELKQALEILNEEIKFMR